MDLESGSRPKGGVRKSTGKIPSLGAEHLNNDGRFNFSKTKHISYSFFNSMKKGKISTGDILIVKDGATTGKIGFVDSEFPFREAAINEHVFRLRVDESMAWPDYIFHYLQSPTGKVQILSDFRGATVGGISRVFVEKVRVPLPSLPEQRRIAAILDKANAIRRKQQEAIWLAEGLLLSTFQEFFGDPVKKDRGWRTSSLGQELQFIEGGWSPRCQDRPTKLGEWGVLKLGAVTTCQYLDQENKALPAEPAPRPDLEIKPRDVLFSRKNTYDLVAACAFVHETRPNLILPDLIFRLLLKETAKVLPEYLWGVLTHPGKRKQVQSLAGGSAGSMPNISKSRLRTVEIVVPPISLQKKFAAKMARVRKLQAKQELSQYYIDSLFNSLVQQAFRGEL